MSETDLWRVLTTSTLSTETLNAMQVTLGPGWDLWGVESFLRHQDIKHNIKIIWKRK
jgi:hypothetical protein